MRLHKIVQFIIDAEALHLLRLANVATGSLFHFLFHVNNLAQRLQAPAAVVVTHKNNLPAYYQP